MGREEGHITHDPQAVLVCPACGQPVGTAVKRHKTLGAWVPVWEALPCENPECERFGRKADGPHPGETEASKSGRREEAQERSPGQSSERSPGQSPERSPGQSPGQSA